MIYLFIFLHLWFKRTTAFDWCSGFRIHVSDHLRSREQWAHQSTLSQASSLRSSPLSLPENPGKARLKAKREKERKTVTKQITMRMSAPPSPPTCTWVLRFSWLSSFGRSSFALSKCRPRPPACCFCECRELNPFCCTATPLTCLANLVTCHHWSTTTHTPPSQEINRNPPPLAQILI